MIPGRYTYVHPEDRQKVKEAFIAIQSKEDEPTDLLYRVLNQSGDYLFLEMTIKLVNASGKPYFYIVAHDISDFKKKEQELVEYKNQLSELVVERTQNLQQMVSEYKKTEQELRTLNRAHMILSKCGGVINRADETIEMLSEICQIIVEVGQYSLAWVGYAQNDKKKTVSPVAYFGSESGYLENLEVSWGGNLKGQGPTGTAIRNGEPSINKNSETNSSFVSWQEKSQKHGLNSSISLPLSSENVTIGALNIYSPIVDAFQEKEVKLFMELAEIISFNIKALREQVEAKKARADRTVAEEMLAKQKVLNIRADRLQSLGEMSAGIAHELNQPLSGIRGIAELLVISQDKDWDTSREKIRKDLSIIIKQADRMSHIIEHVRLFSREAGKPEVSVVNVNEVISSTVQMLGEQFRVHGLELNVKTDNSKPMVLVNPFSLEEVLLNLLSNARDSVEERLKKDGLIIPDIRVHSLVSRTDSGDVVEILTSDNGIGMSAETLSNAIDPFFTTKGPDKGTGLGLSICNSIIDSFDGSLEIRSEEGLGTQVKIILPFIKNPTEKDHG